jgi:hypothetical protein
VARKSCEEERMGICDGETEENLTGLVVVKKEEKEEEKRRGRRRRRRRRRRRWKRKGRGREE